MNHVDNKDQHELDHFAAQGDQWWDINGPMKTLHDINPTRLKFIQQHQPLTGLKVLDIGCGAGLLSEAMAKAGAQVTGIDLAEHLIHVAQQHALEQGLTIHYQSASAESMATSHTEQFDVVVCMEMLEHVPDPQAIIQAASKCLVPNGWLFASTINRTDKAKILTVWLAEQLLRLIPTGTHDPDKFIAPHQLVHWASHAHLRAHKLMGLHYNPINRRTELSMPADVNYLMAFQKDSADS